MKRYPSFVIEFLALLALLPRTKQTLTVFSSIPLEVRHELRIVEWSFGNRKPIPQTVELIVRWSTAVANVQEQLVCLPAQTTVDRPLHTPKKKYKYGKIHTFPTWHVIIHPSRSETLPEGVLHAELRCYYILRYHPYIPECMQHTWSGCVSWIAEK